MTPEMEEQVRTAALRCLAERKAHQPHHKLKNDALRAGSPMFYYCEICGWLAAIMHEEHVAPVPKFCYDCDWMKEQGYIE